MPFLAVAIALFGINVVSKLGGGTPPPPGAWSAHDGSRLVLHEDGSATWTEDGRIEQATTTFEAPLLHVEVGSETITFLLDGADLSRAGGQHPPYRREAEAQSSR